MCGSTSSCLHDSSGDRSDSGVRSVRGPVLACCAREQPEHVERGALGRRGTVGVCAVAPAEVEHDPADALIPLLGGCLAPGDGKGRPAGLPLGRSRAEREAADDVSQDRLWVVPVVCDRPSRGDPSLAHGYETQGSCCGAQLRDRPGEILGFALPIHQSATPVRCAICSTWAGLRYPAPVSAAPSPMTSSSTRNGPVSSAAASTLISVVLCAAGCASAARRPREPRFRESSSSDASSSTTATGSAVTAAISSFVSSMSKASGVQPSGSQARPSSVLSNTRKGDVAGNLEASPHRRLRVLEVEPDAETLYRLRNGAELGLGVARVAVQDVVTGERRRSLLWGNVGAWERGELPDVRRPETSDVICLLPDSMRAAAGHHSRTILVRSLSAVCRKDLRRSDNPLAAAWNVINDALFDQSLGRVVDGLVGLAETLRYLRDRREGMGHHVVSHVTRDSANLGVNEDPVELVLHVQHILDPLGRADSGVFDPSGEESNPLMSMAEA